MSITSNEADAVYVYMICQDPNMMRNLVSSFRSMRSELQVGKKDPSLRSTSRIGTLASSHLGSRVGGRWGTNAIFP